MEKPAECVKSAKEELGENVSAVVAVIDMDSQATKYLNSSSLQQVGSGLLQKNFGREAQVCGKKDLTPLDRNKLIRKAVVKKCKERVKECMNVEKNKTLCKRLKRRLLKTSLRPLDDDKLTIMEEKLKLTMRIAKAWQMPRLCRQSEKTQRR